MGRRVSMAIQTPTHAQWFYLPHYFHLVNVAMTALTANACAHVSTVIEIGVIGNFVDTLPRNRRAIDTTAIPRAHKYSQLEGILIRLLRVAIHTRLCWWHTGIRGFIRHIMAIKAVDIEIRCVGFVAKRYGLFRLKSHIQI